MNIKEFKNKLLKNPEVSKEYYSEDLFLDTGNMVLEARIKVGITQKELAKRVGTKQPSIARIENGHSLPTLTFLERIAKALGTKLTPPLFQFLSPGQSSFTAQKVQNETNFVNETQIYNEVPIELLYKNSY